MRTNWSDQWKTLYAAGGEPSPYNDDAQTYVRAGLYLSGPGLVEEWGCATTWGKRFIGAPYRGVDGATGDPAWNVTHADLREYRSNVPKALMRHVLEHNWEWETILENFLASFTDRAVVILFLPPGKGTIDLPGAANVKAVDDPPGLQLDEATLDRILAKPGLLVHKETLRTVCPPYNWERMYFLEKG